MVDLVNRVLNYRRAVFADANISLQAELARAHHGRARTRERTFLYNDGEMVCAKSLARRSPGPLLLHLTTYVRERPAATVPLPSEAVEIDTTTQPPPRNQNFVDGDLFALVKGNHVIYCASGVREGALNLYIRLVLQHVGLQDELEGFHLTAVADVNKVRTIAEEGVKSIRLGASLYEATLEREERTTVKKKLLGDVADAFFALFADDERLDLREIHERENLNVEVVIKYDSRQKGGDIGMARLDATAQSIVSAEVAADGDEHDGQFKIETFRGTKLTSDEIKVSKPIRLPPKGPTVFREDAWRALEAYLSELQTRGVVHQ